MTRTVQCVKLGREAAGLARPPLPGDLGKRIFEHVSQQAWQQWLLEQTRIINENELELADRQAREFLVQRTEEYFFGATRSGQTGPARYTPAEKQ